MNEWRGSLIVTRPEREGEQLCAELRAAGIDAFWLPAFDLGPPGDPAAALAVLGQLGPRDLAVFVSPAAVRAVAALRAAPWPAVVPLGAVGAATARQVRALIPGAQDAELIAPDGDEADAASGAEAFWDALERRAGHRGWPERLLLLRAASGRDWLLDRCAAQGIAAQAVAVYARTPHAVVPAARVALESIAARAAAAGPVAALFTSSEAIEVLDEQLAAWPGLREALRRGPALATHPRVAARLQSRGWHDVRVCAPEAWEVVRTLGQDASRTPG